MGNKMLLLFLGCVCVASAVQLRQTHPDFGLSGLQVIKKYGYPVEVHKITTEDGYILETHRIPYGKNNASNNAKHPVLIMPGLLCGSAIWTNLGESDSLAFMLADAGYDVWLANYRGTTLSKKHNTLDPNTNKKQFFDFSFQEIGVFDATANINYILNATKRDDLFYIGHSQGTSAFFSLVASKPEYNKKIRLMTALAPVAYTTNIESPILKLIKENLWLVQLFVELKEIYEILPFSPIITVAAQLLCNNDSQIQPMCAELLYFIAGRSINFDAGLIPVIASSTPSGGSSRSFLHYAQLANADTFQAYDFGKKVNLEKYGQDTPPKYDIGKITVPVAVYYADQDTLSTVKDVNRLTSQLTNLVKNKLIKDYSHLDHLWATNVVSALYNDILQDIKGHS